MKLNPTLYRLIALVAFATLVSSPRHAFAADQPDEGGDAGTVDERPPVGLEGIELKELENDFEPEAHRLIIPPYYQETRGPLKLHFVFPLFYFRERTGEGARTDLGVLPFYWRYREKNELADVYFPLYWRFRGPDYKTDIVLQTYYNRSSHGYNLGFGPLFFIGKDERDKSSYQVVPPLFWRFIKSDSKFLLAGLYYNHRKGENFDMGLPPLFFTGRDRYKTYLVILPPVYWRFTDEIAYTTQNVIPPFFYNTREHGWSFGLFPILYLARDVEWDRTMILPFYYGSRWPERDKTGEVVGEGKTYVFPFIATYFVKGPGLTQGGFAMFYHWYWREGDYLRMYSPLVWMYGNDRADDDALLIPPLFYRRESPVRKDAMYGLVLWNFNEYHRERTFAIAPLFAHNWNLYETNWRTWVFPTFDFGRQPDGYHVRLHPIFYLQKKKRSDHLVVAPIWWKFTDEQDDNFVFFPLWWRFKNLEFGDQTHILFPFWWQFDKHHRKRYTKVAFPLYWDVNNKREENRTTLVLPLFWRDKDQRSTMTGILNFVWHKGQIKGNKFWTFRMVPFIGFGKPPAPDGAYWSFLSGLVAWRRQGSTKQLRLFWIPFNLSD